MSIYGCPHGDCQVILADKDHARDHYQAVHSETEYETPQEYLGEVESQQLDLSLDEARRVESDPELLVDPDPPGEAERTSLGDWADADESDEGETGHD